MKQNHVREILGSCSALASRTVAKQRWLLCFSLVLGFGFFLWRPQVGLAAGGSNLQCYTGLPCPIAVKVGTQDPESDPLSVAFSATPASYSFQSGGLVSPCDLDGQVNAQPPSGNPLTCTTPKVQSANQMVATGNYLFQNQTTYTANVLVCDDASHCTSYGIGVDVQPQTVYPTITTFAPQQLTTNLPKLAWSVNDVGGPGLNHLEVWRTSDLAGAPDPAKWGEVTKPSHLPPSATGYTDTTLSSSGSADGKYWYGLHIVDAAGVCITEAARDCASGSSISGHTSTGPDVLTYDTQAPVVVSSAPGKGEIVKENKPMVAVSLSDSSSITSCTLDLNGSKSKQHWSLSGSGTSLSGQAYDTTTDPKKFGCSDPGCPLANDDYTVALVCNDAAGNTLNTSWQFSIENQQPNQPKVSLRAATLCRALFSAALGS